MVDIHNYKKRAERTLASLDRFDISRENKKLIEDFYRHNVIDGLTFGKIYRYTEDLRKIAAMLKKNFVECTREDIEKLILEFEKTGYTVWTKYGYRVVVRKFFKWLRKTEGFPPEVSWIRLRQRSTSNRLPDELITELDVKKMIECAEKTRDKAFISLLYESGCRISEILTLRIKNITFDQYGAKINVYGKTGARRIRSISSVILLQKLINEHPDKENSEAFIWLKSNSKQDLVGYDRMRILLTRIAKKAGVKKKVNPHSFRHARASFMANHLTEAQLKEVFGWTQGSKMASVYVHLSGKNTDDAILKLHGKKIKKDDFEDFILEPRICSRCKKENEPTNKFCGLCGSVLDKNTETEIIKQDLERNNMDHLMDRLLKDEEVRLFLTQKINTTQI